LISGSQVVDMVTANLYYFIEMKEIFDPLYFSTHILYNRQVSMALFMIESNKLLMA